MHWCKNFNVEMIAPCSLLRRLALIFVITDGIVQARHLKVHSKSTHSSGQKKTHLEGANTTSQCPNTTAHETSCVPVGIPVPVPVQTPDVNELHVYIHEGRSLKVR